MLRAITFTTFLTVVMLAIFTVMVVMSFGFPADARFMPLIVGVPGIVLCLAQIFVDLRNAGAPAVASAAEPIPALRGLALPDTGEPVLSEGETVCREIVLWSYFLGFIGGLLLFGFWISVPAMLVSFLRFQAGQTWRTALAAGLGASALLYFVFEVMLRIRLHPGFATQFLLKALDG
jgi:hypothetical protein